MKDIRALAISLSDLWAFDYNRMADEVYAPDVVFQDLCGEGREFHGTDALRNFESKLIEVIPDHRLNLMRVIANPKMGFLEAICVAPRTNEYSATGLLWWVGPDGYVAAEAAWFPWHARTNDLRLCRGRLPFDDGRARDDVGFYEALAVRFADLWSNDLDTLFQHMFAVDCVMGVAGQQEAINREEARRNEELYAQRLPLGQRCMTVQDVIGEGGSLAFLMNLTYEKKGTRGVVTLTLDQQNRITACRYYFDWSKAKVGKVLDWPVPKPVGADLDIKFPAISH